MDLSCFIEALLFVADGPTEVADLARALDVDTAQVEEGLRDLARVLEPRGLRLQRAGNRVQLVTMPAAADAVEEFLGLSMGGKLSSAALEALAIVAYRQPITRARVSAIRGVESDSVLRTLTAKGLIMQVGTLEQVGRPVLYGTTFQFLEYFGIASLDELPSLPELEELIEQAGLPAQAEADAADAADA